MEKLPLGLVLDLRKVVPYKTGSWRTMMPLYIMQTPPCTNSCPINNDVRGFLRTLAEKKDYEQAWHILTRTNPLPAICGRVCPHPCEDGCNRRDFDAPWPLTARSAPWATSAWSVAWRIKYSAPEKKKWRWSVPARRGWRVPFIWPSGDSRSKFLRPPVSPAA